MIQESLSLCDDNRFCLLNFIGMVVAIIKQSLPYFKNEVNGDW